jgi:hypothetical protein
MKSDCKIRGFLPIQRTQGSGPKFGEMMFTEAARRPSIGTMFTIKSIGKGVLVFDDDTKVPESGQ